MDPEKVVGEPGAVEEGGSGNGDGGGGKKVPVGRRAVSCTQCFDALWFCYSPVHQMQQYYRLGEFDTCFGKWNALYDCLKLKTKSKSAAQDILEARENGRPHIWRFNTVEEASANWRKFYGHVRGDIPSK